MPVDLSIIIVNFNSFDLTRNCVEQFESDGKLKGINYEVIIIDNGSIDKAENSINNDSIRWIYTKENLGYGKAKQII